MKKQQGPFPGPAFGKQMAGMITVPLMDQASGEFTTNVHGKTLGSQIVGGIVKDVWLSVQSDGQPELAIDLSLTADVYINGTSCLTTNPIIASQSGEAAAQKTTVNSGTGITQAVIDVDNRAFAAGDVFSYDMSITRTTPDAEMINPVICVEVEPYK